jgi:hypothetical protein
MSGRRNNSVRPERHRDLGERMALLVLLAAACGNHLPPPGSCDVTTNGLSATTTPVALGSTSPYDDLRYSPELRKVVAAPLGTGAVYLIDPDSLAIQMVAVPGGVSSADASATVVFGADRVDDRIVAVDIATGAMTSGDLPGTPDYVRFSPMTNELWVTLPGSDRIEILDASSLAPIGSVTVPAPPEGLTIDGDRAYINANGAVVAIDVARRLTVGEWSDGCGFSHGFPQVDPAYDLAFGGCFSNGGVGVVTMDGNLVAGFEAGGGEAIVAYDPVRHHLYVRGDPGDTLDVLATCSDGQLGLLQNVAIPNSGHGASADDRGNVWVADATTGGVIKIVDPFPAAN